MKKKLIFVGIAAVLLILAYFVNSKGRVTDSPKENNTLLTNPSEGGTFSGQTTQANDLEYYIYAVSSLDLNNCAGVSDLELRTKCEKTITEKTEAGFQVDASNDQEYFSQAKSSKNISLCDKIQTDVLKGQCKAELKNP